MPNIMPISELRNTTMISELAHQSDEPIFITKNGYGDLVVMSIEIYKRYEHVDRIDRAISEAEAQLAAGAECISLEDAERNRTSHPRKS